MAIAAKWLLNCMISYTIIGIGVSASVTQLTWLGWLVFIAVLAWSGLWSWAGSVTGTKAVGNVFDYALKITSRLFPNLIAAPQDRTSKALWDIVGAAALLAVGAGAITQR
jgi:hypothetical protein